MIVKEETITKLKVKNLIFLIEFIKNIKYDSLRTNLPKDDDDYIHDSQIECAIYIMLKFLKTKIHFTILFAQMQVGKTGTVNAFLNLVYYIKKNKDKLRHCDELESILKIENIIFTTGMNQNELKKQTKERNSQLVFFNDIVNHENLEFIEIYSILSKYGITIKQYNNNDFAKINIKDPEDKLFLLQKKEHGLKQLPFYDNEFIENIKKRYDDIGMQINHYKNSDMQKIIKNGILSDFNIENAIIMIDEVQYGEGFNSVLDKMFESRNIKFTGENLSINNTHVIAISATPFQQILNDKSFKKSKVIYKTPSNYISCEKFYLSNCLRESSGEDYELDSFGNYPIINKIKEIEDSRDKSKFAYYMIRARTRKDDLHILLGSSYINGTFKIVNLYLDDDKAALSYKDFTKSKDEYEKGIIEQGIEHEKNGNKNPKPVLYILKESFRAGLSIFKKFKEHCVMIYEICNKAETTLQSLLGRFCGFWNFDPDKIVIYTNIFHVKEYINFVKTLQDEYDENDSTQVTKHNMNLILNVPKNKPNSGRTTKEIKLKGLPGFKIKLSKKEILDIKKLVETQRNINQDKIEYIENILKSKRIFKTNQTITVETNLFNEFNEILLTLGATVGYSDNTKISYTNLNTLTSFDTTKLIQSNIGKIYLNVFLSEGFLYVQKGKIEINVYPKTSKKYRNLDTLKIN